MMADMLTMKLQRDRVKLNHVLTRICSMNIFRLRSILSPCLLRNWLPFPKALIVGSPSKDSPKKLRMGLLLMDSNLQSSLLACIQNLYISHENMKNITIGIIMQIVLPYTFMKVLAISYAIATYRLLTFQLISLSRTY